MDLRDLWRGGQAAEVFDEAAGFESEEDDEDVDGVAGVEVDDEVVEDFDDAGVLLDDEPRLSFR